MRFKDSTELPPPRYALDDDEDAQFLQTNISYILDVQGDIAGVERLLVVAPRVLGLRSELTRSLLATIVLTIEESRPAEHSQDFEGWDLDIQEASKRRSFKFSIHNGPQGVSVLALPLLNEAEAAYSAKALVSRLSNLKSMVVATPGTIFDGSAVCHISTSNATVPPLNPAVPGYAPAVPPVIVQGAAAAFLSQAEQHSIPAIGYVVNSDGPLNHEAIQPAHYEVLRRVLHNNLGLNSLTAPEMSTLYV